MQGIYKFNNSEGDNTHKGYEMGEKRLLKGKLDGTCGQHSNEGGETKAYGKDITSNKSQRMQERTVYEEDEQAKVGKAAGLQCFAVKNKKRQRRRKGGKKKKRIVPKSTVRARNDRFRHALY